MLTEKTDCIDKVASGCIIYCEDSIVLFKRSDTGIWNSIAGNMKGEEDPKKSIIREVEEETGLELDPQEVRVLYHKYGDEVVEYHLYFARITKDELKSIRLNYEHTNYSTFTIDEALHLELFEDEDYCQKLCHERFGSKKQA